MLTVVFESTPLAISPFCSTLKTHGKVWLSCEKSKSATMTLAASLMAEWRESHREQAALIQIGCWWRGKGVWPHWLYVNLVERNQDLSESFWKELWSRGQIEGSKLPTEKDSAWVGPLKVRGWQGELQIASYIMEACPGNCRERMGEVLMNHSKIK